MLMAVVRFIPACAGNRGPGQWPPATRSVHPRVCGEQTRTHAYTCADTGSSPRVRGTVDALMVTGQQLRFIPACAGNSAPASLSERTRPVHPRVCGEQHSSPRISGMTLGSSPRVRGTDGKGLNPPFKLRFIPACAGNRRPGYFAKKDPPVHPRVCGEQIVAPEHAVLTYGSSPRVRGTGSEYLQGPETSRFIPACAGNRPSEDRRQDASEVHPRVCGEQGPALIPAASVTGSSPRVRGTVMHF